MLNKNNHYINIIFKEFIKKGTSIVNKFIIYINIICIKNGDVLKYT